MRSAELFPPDYAELHCLSHFTFLRGASHPHELVEQAVKLGYRALAITDECSLSGVVRAHEAAKDHDIKLIIGAEFTLADGPKLVLLAKNREGYAQLSELITRGRRRAEKGAYELTRNDLNGELSDCLLLLIPQVDLPWDSASAEAFLADAIWVSERMPQRSWIAVERLHLPNEQKRIAALKSTSEKTGLKLVAAGDVHMHLRSRRALQDLVTAIRLKTTVAKAAQQLYPNGERHLRHRRQLAALYEPQWLAESMQIAELCDFSLTELRYEYPDDLVPEGLTATAYLRHLTEAGIRHYWPEGEKPEVREQIEHELKLIAELRYEHFFLTVYDLVRFARSKGILCQGRGSAANSAVCYCLHITAVDPARSHMLFERFISKERNEPPDIDVDFENARREEVMQYIYQKYGRHRAALAATLITYRRKSAIRDAGKALGLSLDQVDRLTRTLVWWEKGVAEERLREAGFSPDNPVIKRLMILVGDLVGFPRHLSQHVGGFVIARDKLSRLVPVENAAMVERSIIQWDKNDLESLGLLKVDCLALGMLSVIHRSFDLLRQHCGLEYNLANIPAEDPAVYRMIQRADTIGVFQIESRAQMNMLPRLKPACFYDLVIEVAIVRPGPIQGDMVHPYLKRRTGMEKPDYFNDALKPVLERTLGIPIFQEQVMSIAMIAGGFSAGEADQLRRSMAAWGRSGDLEQFREKLIHGFLNNGYNQAFAERIYRMIKGFGAYGFPESHSASFALLAYISSWLKCHHPAVFTCALLNSQPMGFYAPAQLVQDLRRHDVEVRPVDVMTSGWESTLEKTSAGKLALRLGLHQIKGLSEATGKKIEAKRQALGFTSFQDFIEKLRLNKKESHALAAADAFHRLIGHRHQASWQVLGVDIPRAGLFENMAAADDSEVVLSAPEEAEEIVADYARLGMTLRRHPMALLRASFDRYNCLPSTQLVTHPNHRKVRVAGMVINRQHPNAGGTIFITLEDEFGTINIVVWERVAARFIQPVIHGRLLLIAGKLERAGDTIHIIAHQIEDRSQQLGRLQTQSRDFH
ncbi:MAG: error-prone DNA polymerase [Thiotrichales bacterium]